MSTTRQYESEWESLKSRRGLVEGTHPYLSRISKRPVWVRRKKCFSIIEIYVCVVATHFAAHKCTKSSSQASETDKNYVNIHFQACSLFKIFTWSVLTIDSSELVIIWTAQLRYHSVFSIICPFSALSLVFFAISLVFQDFSVLFHPAFQYVLFLTATTGFRLIQ